MEDWGKIERHLKEAQECVETIRMVSSWYKMDTKKGVSIEGLQSHLVSISSMARKAKKHLTKADKIRSNG